MKNPKSKGANSRSSGPFTRVQKCKTLPKLFVELFTYMRFNKSKIRHADKKQQDFKTGEGRICVACKKLRWNDVTFEVEGKQARKLETMHK